MLQDDIAQDMEAQVGVAFAREHPTEQPPQSLSVLSGVSQPAAPVQSPQPPEQPPWTHDPVAHDAEAWG